MMRVVAGLATSAAFAAVVLAQDNSLTKPVEQSRKLALQVSQEHRSQLIKEMQLSGPLRSLLMCKYRCPEITSSQSRKTGWKVSMVSLKPRNSAVGMADVWEQTVLADFARRLAKGEKAEVLEYAEIVSEPQGKYFRYAKAILVEPLCLTCHGASETLPASVKAQLAIDYPFDRATGYSAGQVYGIVSIKRPH